MKKMLFEEPEMEVVRFDPRDIYTSTSGGAEYSQEDGGEQKEEEIPE